MLWFIILWIGSLGLICSRDMGSELRFAGVVLFLIMSATIWALS